MKILLLLLLVPIFAISQQNYMYHFRDFKKGNQIMTMDFQKQDFHYPNRIPLVNKSTNVSPINLGFGFSNSKYDKNMSGAYDVIHVDSFYYIAGRTRIGANTLFNNELMFSMKIDLQGNVVWKRMDSLVDADHWDIYYGHTLTQLDNGNFAQLAFYPKYDSIKKFQYIYPLISKFNKNGDLISKFVMNYDSIPDWNDSITFLPYGGILTHVNEKLILFGNLTSKTWIWKSDINSYIYDSLYLGIVVIDSNYLGTNFKKISHPNFGRGVIVYNSEKTSDNGYLITIHSYQFKKDFIVKLDSNLNYEWNNAVGDSVLYYWNPVKAIESKNGGYIYVREYPVDKMDYYGEKAIAYGKLNNNGILLWEKKCQLYNDTTQSWNGIFNMPMGIIEQNNGDILFSTRINIDRGAGLVRTDSLGNIKWYRWILGMYGDIGSQINAGGMFLYNMRKPIGEGVLLVGHAGYGKAQLIRTDSLGCTLPNCIDTNLHLGYEELEQIRKQELIIYPNPAQNQIQIAINQQGTKVKLIRVYNISGKEVLRCNANNYLVNIDISSLAKSIYIIKVESSLGDIICSKFIKQ